MIEWFSQEHNGAEFDHYRYNERTNGVCCIGEKRFTINGLPKISLMKNSYKYGKELQFSIVCPKESFTESKRNKSQWNVMEINLPLEVGIELIRTVLKDYDNKQKGGTTNMATIKQEAQTYESPQTKNIAELKEVSVDFELLDREGQDAEGKTFKYMAINVNGEDYRVPGKVLGDLRAILEKKPDLKTFSVTRKGEGIKTQYTVIPMN